MINDNLFDFINQLYLNKQYQQTLSECTNLLSQNSDDFRLWYLAGCSSFELKNYQSAMSCLYQAATNNPRFYEAFHMLGNLFLAMDEKDNAIKFWLEAEKLNPKGLVTITNLASIFLDLNNYKQASLYANKALALNSNCIEAIRCLQKIAQHKKDLRLVQSNLEKILLIEPNDALANFDYSYILFLRRSYKKAFYHYEFRKKLQDRLDQYNFLPFAEGITSGCKKILIYHEQGFGDNIQFVRFLPMLEKQNIFFGVQNSLNKLFSYSFPSIKMISDIDGDMEFDCCTSLMSIPYEIGLDNIPIGQYLFVDKHDVELFLKKINSNKFKVGLVWKGSSFNKSNLEFCNFENFLDLENVEFYSFQLDSEETNPKIKHFKTAFNDFYDTAVAASAMDLMITIDTAIAHLCGALGVATIVLVNDDLIDWRWMVDKNGFSMWYPSVVVHKFQSKNKKEIIGKVKLYLRNVVL